MRREVERARGESGDTMIGRLSAIIALLAAVGCQAPRVDEEEARARFYVETGGSGVEVRLPVSEVALTVEAKPVFTEFDFVAVEAAEVELGRCVMFRLTREAARDLYRLTAANQGRRLVLMVDGEALGARPIEAPMEEGELLVFVEKSDEELVALVRRLQQTTARVRAEVKR